MTVFSRARADFLCMSARASGFDSGFRFNVHEGIA